MEYKKREKNERDGMGYFSDLNFILTLFES